MSLVVPASGAELGYAEITTTPATVTTLADVTGLTVDVVVGSRPIMVRAWFADWQNDTIAGGCIVSIAEDGTTIASSSASNPVANTRYAVAPVAVRRSPTPGVHTYKVTAARLSAGTLQLTATTTKRAYIQVVEC